MIKEEIKKKATEINEMLENFLPAEEGRASKLAESMNYSVRVGGKRLRPMMMVESCKLFGNEHPALLDFAAALEMIHTYSLIHDDLPAMDNDEYRRGHLTNHAKYGEAAAILAGDGLLNYAFEIVANALAKCKGDEAAVRAFCILSKKAGLFGMIGGQSVDVESEKTGVPLDLDDLDFVYKLKTCALIEAALEVGAVLGGADEAQQEIASRVGYAIGMAFQIQDDILDIEGDQSLLGKPIGSDEKNNKNTMASLLGVEEAKKKVSEYTNMGLESLEKLPGDHTFLKNLFLYLVTRDN